jgi:hypothetical protein
MVSPFGCAVPQKTRLLPLSFPNQHSLTESVRRVSNTPKQIMDQLDSCFKAYILSEAVVQAERRISRAASVLHARSLVPLVKARDFGMTPATEVERSVSTSPPCLRRFVPRSMDSLNRRTK